MSLEGFLAPRVDRHLGATERYIHPSKDRTIEEHRLEDLPPLPMEPMETTLFTRDQFSIDALAFMNTSLDRYPIYRFEPRENPSISILFPLDPLRTPSFFSEQIAVRPVMFL